MKEVKAADYVTHMLDAARMISSYTDGMSKDDFLLDTRTQQAVIFNIIIIGEAVTKLLKDHQELINQFYEVPWTSMKGMRNRIAHGYFDINLNTVWESAKENIPELLVQLPIVLMQASI